MWPCWRSPCSWPGADTGICRSGDRQCARSGIPEPAAARAATVVELGWNSVATWVRARYWSDAIPYVSAVVLDHVRVFVSIKRAGDLDSSEALTIADIACDVAKEADAACTQSNRATPRSAPVAVNGLDRSSDSLSRKKDSNFTFNRSPHANQPVPIDCDGECSGPRGDPRVGAYRVNPRVPGSSPG